MWADADVMDLRVYSGVDHLCGFISETRFITVLQVTLTSNHSVMYCVFWLFFVPDWNNLSCLLGSCYIICHTNSTSHVDIWCDELLVVITFFFLTETTWVIIFYLCMMCVACVLTELLGSVGRGITWRMIIFEKTTSTIRNVIVRSVEVGINNVKLNMNWTWFIITFDKKCFMRFKLNT